MVVKDDSEVVNSGNNKTYIFKSTCQIQNVNNVLSDKNHTSKKVKKKKSLIKYKNLNLELLEKIKPIVVTKTVEQESFR